MGDDSVGDGVKNEGGVSEVNFGREKVRDGGGGEDSCACVGWRRQAERERMGGTQCGAYLGREGVIGPAQSG